MVTLKLKRVGTPNGFTIVELLIVVVVIAILAAIILVAYNGITQRATISDLQSSLRTAANKMESYKTLNNDSYPLSLSIAGVPIKSGVETRFNSDGSRAYCLSYKKGNDQYYISNIVASPTSGKCPPATPTLVAGSEGSPGYVDNATGSSARFGNSVYGIAAAPDGTVYLADNASDGNRYIRKITPSGAVTTLVQVGFGPLIYALGLDTAGNVYVVNSSDSTLRKVTPTGTMTTLANLGTNLSNGVASIAVDPSGNVYLPDPWENRILRVTATGVVSNFAGSGVAGSSDGNGTAAQFDSPQNIVYSPDGNLYVKNNTGIRRVTLAGAVTTPYRFESNYNNSGCAASPIKDCSASDTWFSLGAMGGLAVDNKGYLYFGESWAAVKQISPTGTLSVVAGMDYNGLSNTSSLGPSAPLSNYTYTWMVAADHQGNIYVMRGSALYRFS